MIGAAEIEIAMVDYLFQLFPRLSVVNVHVVYVKKDYEYRIEDGKFA